MNVSSASPHIEWYLFGKCWLLRSLEFYFFKGVIRWLLFHVIFFTCMDSKSAAEGSLVGVFSTIKNMFSTKDFVRLVSVGGFENVTFHSKKKHQGLKKASQGSIYFSQMQNFRKYCFRKGVGFPLGHVQFLQNSALVFAIIFSWSDCCVPVFFCACPLGSRPSFP